jgi:hypothetical protein
MARTQQLHDATGVLIRGGTGGALFVQGGTPPADGLAGYGPGCIFLATGSGEDTTIYVNDGTITSCDFNPLPTGVTASSSELNRLDDTYAVMPTLAGVGITAGVGAVYKTSVLKVGTLITTQIYIDLTGLASSTTDLDIIGVAGGPAHIGQVTAARNGTIEAIRMTCLELPAGGADDIDLYAATEGTGEFDAGIGTLAETALITAGGAWANGTVKGSIAVPSANQYLYLTGGEGGTAGTYTAGKFLIELFGY